MQADAKRQLSNRADVARNGKNEALTIWASKVQLGEEMSRQIIQRLTDTPPDSDSLTDYDRAQLKLYARLLDAEADGADLSEIAHHLFGIDAADEPERARRVHDSHLVRAHWVAEQGYRELLINA